jgi:hypothetical protein
MSGRERALKTRHPVSSGTTTSRRGRSDPEQENTNCFKPPQCWSVILRSGGIDDPRANRSTA